MPPRSTTSAVLDPRFTKNSGKRTKSKTDRERLKRTAVRDNIITLQEVIVAQYIEFKTPSSSQPGSEPLIPLIIEVQESEAPRGIAKAGLREVAGKTVQQATTLIEDAIRGSVSAIATAFHDAVKTLPEPPAETEVSFGLKITGEAGNIAISKAGAEANFNVKLIWKGTAEAK
ncbi:MAG TPA: CU044_2847 family protein [Bryobacteraceae bacterium]|jgi:hypothetical protein